MESFASIHETTPLCPTTLLDLFQKANAAGMSANALFVLSALMEASVLVPGEPSVAMSRYEISKRLGISWQKVQRALTELATLGWIARRQNAKAEGEVATTTLTKAAHTLFGFSGGAELGVQGLPADFNVLLVGESESLISTIAEAWRNNSLPCPEAVALFRGGMSRWEQLMGILEAQNENNLRLAGEIAEQAALEIETELAESTQKRFTLDFANGKTVVFDQNRFAEAAKHLDIGIRSSDLRFARDVIKRVNERNPGMLTPAMVPKLAAEILYSRQKGYVWKHDCAHAFRVLAKQIAKAWSKPKKITLDWYHVTNASVAVA